MRRVGKHVLFFGGNFVAEILDSLVGSDVVIGEIKKSVITVLG